jgi:GNAT superfamily N-acetyltransferase
MGVQGIVVRRGLAPEKHLVVSWVAERFSSHWMSECESAFYQTPPTCWIATEGKQVIGFACYDTTAKGFFGPTGVSEEARGRGVGKILLIACLHAMRSAGYGYAVIGSAGPVEFYQKAVGAIVIEDSSPGVYRGMLH